MTKQAHDISATIATKDIKKCDIDSDFTQNVINLSVGTCNARKFNDIDIDSEKNETRIALEALNAKGALQEMLAAQMLSVHQLQQRAMMFANRMIHVENAQYFTNTAIKLANTFAQQAGLMNKLQCNGEQKIIVEHVEVHHGGQAIVGNVNVEAPGEMKK